MELLSEQESLIHKLHWLGLLGPMDNSVFININSMVDMEESIRRFNIVLGVEESERSKDCMQQYFAPTNGRRRLQEEKAKNDMNSNPHPKILEGSPEYQVLAERNALDMILYNYITLLYEEQRMWIDSLVTQQ